MYLFRIYIVYSSCNNKKKKRIVVLVESETLGG